ncbi:MAG: epoxyqueuosine reductase QueH [Rickettsiales bacterium]|jgi:predicted adenine nucleotide alpha hydrolase (AANH) superfamily ATPase|nr:epoxyqueuosine reductase QueH [Rickettsiales bacterium]
MLKNNRRIVLMSCCAPCSAGAILQMKNSGNDFCVLFYNPNIFPESEYNKRLAEQIKLCEAHGVKYAVGDYNHESWLACVGAGRENEPERGKRCSECFRHRFAYGIKWARDNGYDAIASVFGVSRWKNQLQVDFSAQLAISNEQLSIIYLSVEWDESLRIAENKRHNFYRQNYCGCEYSIRKV